MPDDVRALRGSRVDLVPATIALLEAETRSNAELGRLLEAEVPADWPPGEYDADARDHFLARLREDPSIGGWLGWYALARLDGDHLVLIGAGGYFGPPSPDGTVEIGYSIVPAYRRRGYATEIAEVLVQHAWSMPWVRRVIARTEVTNHGSVAVLERCRFRLTSTDPETGQVQYELRR